MGTCLSKKSVCVNSSSAVSLPIPPEKKHTEEQPVVKKEVFIIKHRTSHEIERQKSDEERGEPKKAEEFAGNGESGSSRDASNCGATGVVGGAAVRTSSCTKEEVDAILIQCGRLSRSSSTGKAAATSTDNGRRQYAGSKRSYDFDNDGGNNGDDERENRRRERHRQSPGRRRTPSRERDREQLRSGSRERANNGGRRVSRSPGRRSESPITTTANSDSNSNPNSRPGPGKMVSVPATVSMDKTTDASNSIKRIQVKRNVTSPRARSPARCRDNVSLSRSNSRKADNSSPYRRNPLAEIDTNVIIPQKPNADTRTHCKEEAKPSPLVMAENVSMNVIQENSKPQTITRSRSSRLSWDLNTFNPESLPNPNGSSMSSSSYTALLLEDIQNFHQKKSNPPGPITLPPCVTKAQSILDAVANLNAASNPMMDQLSKKPEIEHGPVLESEVVGNGDDLMEPSFHKYVTVRRGGGTDDFEEQQESSGSNSIAGSQQQQWVSSSGWEPNSAESTDRCAASSSSSRAVSISKQSGAMSESGGGGKRVATAAKKRDCDGIGRGRIGTRVTHSMIAPTAAAST